MSILSRASNYLKQYGFFNMVRKSVFLLWTFIFSGVALMTRRVSFYIRTKNWIKSIMEGAKVKGIGNNIIISYDAAFYENSILEICEKSRLRIGRNFTLSYSSVIACREEIIIGDYVMVGEFTSLRDTTHSFEKTSVPFVKQQDISKAITIGNNVWIGRGCIVLPGTTIGDNVVIGANSVVKGDIQSGYVYAGSPLKVIKQIEEKEVPGK